ncbi:MAG: hypothetical protein ABIJ34_01370 [archaeon]
MAHAPPKAHNPFHGLHVEIPGQFLLGLVFMSVGTLLTLKLLGKNYVPFIPQEYLVWICAVGAAVGGFYLILAKIWRPPIWFRP